MLLKRLVPSFHGLRGIRQARNIGAIALYLDPLLEQWGINTLLRKAHFLGQTAVETWYFADVEEEASGSAYEGRRSLGNTEPGDGHRYLGRGMIQLTGRANYMTANRDLRHGEILHRRPNPDDDRRSTLCIIPSVDLIAHPEALDTFPTAIQASCAYWIRRGINRAADADDSYHVSHMINALGLQQATRKLLTEKAKALLEQPDLAEIDSAQRKNLRGE